MAAAVKTAQERRYCKRAVRVRLPFRMKLNNPWCRFLLITRANPYAGYPLSPKPMSGNRASFVLNAAGLIPVSTVVYLGRWYFTDIS